MRDVRLLGEGFDPAGEVARFTRECPGAGGVSSFTGMVRCDRGVEALELSHYEPLTLSGMESLASRALERFDLLGLMVLHRTGLMQPGEAIVCVAAAARHRRDAIRAVDFCMDHLKSAAWFWKREKRGGTWHWIEPRSQDYADLARWENGDG